MSETVNIPDPNIPKNVLDFLLAIEEDCGVSQMRKDTDITWCKKWCDDVEEYLVLDMPEENPNWQEDWYKYLGQVVRKSVNTETFNQNWFEVEFKRQNGEIDVLFWSPDKGRRFKLEDSPDIDRRILQFRDLNRGTEIIPSDSRGKRSSLGN